MRKVIFGEKSDKKCGEYKNKIGLRSEIRLIWEELFLVRKMVKNGEI